MKSRFSELARLQYERRLTPVEMVELDLCSAEMTFEDRIDTGIPVNPDSQRRIEGLRARFVAMKAAEKKT